MYQPPPPSFFPASTVIQTVRDNMDLMVLMPKSFLDQHGKGNKIVLTIKGLKFKIFFSPLDHTRAECPALMSIPQPNSVDQYIQLLEVLRPLAHGNETILKQLLLGLASPINRKSAVPLVDLTEDHSTNRSAQSQPSPSYKPPLKNSSGKQFNKRKITGTVTLRTQSLTFQEKRAVPYDKKQIKQQYSYSASTSSAASGRPEPMWPQPLSQGHYNTAEMFGMPAFRNGSDQQKITMATADVSYEPSMTDNNFNLQLMSQNYSLPLQQTPSIMATNPNMMIPPYTETMAESLIASPAPYRDLPQSLTPAPEGFNNMTPSVVNTPLSHPTAIEPLPSPSVNLNWSRNTTKTYNTGNQYANCGYGYQQQWNPPANQMSSSFNLLPPLVQPGMSSGSKSTMINRHMPSSSAVFMGSEYNQVKPSSSNQNRGQRPFYPVAKDNEPSQLPDSTFGNSTKPTAHGTDRSTSRNILSQPVKKEDTCAVAAGGGQNSSNDSSDSGKLMVDEKAGAEMKNGASGGTHSGSYYNSGVGLGDGGMIRLIDIDWSGKSDLQNSKNTQNTVRAQPDSAPGSRPA